MARKLKSDKLLFLATLLLVCTSVLMVYSASAALAMDRYQQPYLFLFKQVTWAVLGVCLLLTAMQVDYRNLKQPAVIWAVLGLATAALVAVLFCPPINGNPAVVWCQWNRGAAIRAGQGCCNHLLGGDPGTTDEPDRRGVLFVAARGCGHGWRQLVDLARARLRYSTHRLVHRRRDGLRGRSQLSIFVRCSGRAHPASLRGSCERRLPTSADCWCSSTHGKTHLVMVSRLSSR